MRHARFLRALPAANDYLVNGNVSATELIPEANEVYYPIIIIIGDARRTVPVPP